MSENLYADINKIKVCYNIKGEGFPVILLHGFAMYKEFWFTMINKLAENFKVIAVDNRSCGKSDHPSELYGIDTMANDVKGLMDFLKIEKAHIIGHSLGGMIAQNFNLLYPDLVEKLVLMATFSKLPLDESGLEMYKKSQLATYESKLDNPNKAFYDKIKLRFTRNFYKAMVEDPKKKFYGLFSTEDIVDMENYGTTKPQDILNLIHVITTHNTIDQLPNIKNNVLIIAGEKDKIVSKVASIEMDEKIPYSTLKIVKGGHWFPLENAPEVNDTIIDFLIN